MNFILFDLEATCWDGPSPSGIQEVIEIGAIKFSQVGERIGAFSELVKPKVNPYLSPFCQQLTGITQSELERARDFKRVIKSFLDWVDMYEEDFILCAWGDEDQTMLINDCKLHGLDDDWTDDYIDIKRQYRELKKLNKQFGLKKCLRLEGFEFDGVPHRALDDTENTAKIFLRYLDEWMF